MENQKEIYGINALGFAGNKCRFDLPFSIGYSVTNIWLCLKGNGIYDNYSN
jgi:hypothetical protein